MTNWIIAGWPKDVHTWFEVRRKESDRVRSVRVWTGPTLDEARAQLPECVTPVAQHNNFKRYGYEIHTD